MNLYSEEGNLLLSQRERTSQGWVADKPSTAEPIQCPWWCTSWEPCLANVEAIVDHLEEEVSEVAEEEQEPIKLRETRHKEPEEQKDKTTHHQVIEHGECFCEEWNLACSSSNWLPSHPLLFIGNLIKKNCPCPRDHCPLTIKEEEMDPNISYEM